MLKHLIRKVHARYAASANGALLGDFAAWLVSGQYCRLTEAAVTPRPNILCGVEQQSNLPHPDPPTLDST